MNGQDFNLRHLRAFTLVCRLGGVTAAAGAVHMSQPAITQAIAKLEAILAERLLVRSSRGMYPTEAGNIFARRSERALNILKQGCLDAAGRQKSGTTAQFDTRITSTQLRALIAVATYGNFSVAARANGVSQPSLYRTARELEKVSGLTLYRESESGYEPTAAARILIRAAKLAFYDLDQALDELSSWRGAKSGRIVVGALPLSRSALLPQAINRMTRVYPDIDIHVIDGPYGDLLNGLRHGEIDLMLGALRDPTPADDVTQTRLFDDRLGIFCHPGHPLADHHDIPLAQLTKYPWVLPRQGTPTREQATAFFRTRSLPNPTRVIETSSMVLARGLLKGSNRLTMMSVSQAQVEIEHGAMQQLPIEIGDTPRPIGITRRLDWQPTELQERFLTVLKDVAVPSPK
ncbi:Galactose-binding protein regulator [Thalassovita gelatinovora]|uniref:Galactose-binding protein regulator n=2 Tax=Thalassovita gelatinovora TaxID=53501 RepID=A0A0P1F7G7_THAGE|nr:Galactose-binding protein regulator [Thalassovita gelatinovora]SEQ80124.1 DNA-binding transcriptional regulator, LysR family [Thalassovita gelatinovora]